MKSKNKLIKQKYYEIGALCSFKSSTLSVFLCRDQFAVLPTLVSDTSRGESRACLFCQWNNDNVIVRVRFATAHLPRGRRLDADMLIWRPFRDIKFSVYRFSPDEPRLDVHIIFRYCAFNHGICVFFGVFTISWGLYNRRHESLLS